MPPDDDDEAFRQIIAGFSQEAADPVPRWPVAEDADPAPAPDTVVPVERPVAEGLPGWLEPEALPDEGHFEPPDPPRLPHIRLRVVAAAVLLLAGLAALLAPYRVGLDDSGGSLLLGVLLCTGGGVLLLGSLHDGPGKDQGPDDGAVV